MHGLGRAAQAHEKPRALGLLMVFNIWRVFNNRIAHADVLPGLGFRLPQTLEMLLGRA